MSAGDIFGSHGEGGGHVFSLGENKPGIGFWPRGAGSSIFVDIMVVWGSHGEGGGNTCPNWENTGAERPWSRSFFPEPYGVEIWTFWWLKVSEIPF